MYVPFPPGGGIDVTARIFADKASEILGQQIVIINQGGGGGAIATDEVVRAEPDGYTLLYHSVTGIVHASVTPKLPYDWLRDLAPVSLITRFAPVMIVSPSLPVKDMKDFIALLKANPGKYSYGSSGTGTAVHLITELFKEKAGVDIVHVPYHGTVAVLPDLMSGRVVDDDRRRSRRDQQYPQWHGACARGDDGDPFAVAAGCSHHAGGRRRLRSAVLDRPLRAESKRRKRSSTSSRPRPTKPCTTRR